jgi:hypothetical protein
LRGLLQVAPNYLKPVLGAEGLLGSQQMTSYDVGIAQTLAWIGSSR